MKIEQVLALIPDDKREEAKKALEEHGAVTADKVSEYLKTDDGKKLVTPLIDSAVSKAVSSHDKKFTEEKLPGLVDEEVKKRFPDKTPEQKELAELKAKLDKSEKDRIRTEQKARAIKQLQDLGLPLSLADRYHGQSDEETDESIKALKEVIDWKDGQVKAKDDEWLKKSGGAPGGGDATPKPTMKRDEFNALDPIKQREALKTTQIID